MKRVDSLDDGRFPVVSQEADLVNGYWDDENGIIKADRPLVVFGDHTRVVKFVDFDFVAGADGTKVLSPCNEIDPRYFYYFLLAHPVGGLGYARHFKLLKELRVRFPKELAEQKRIVAILDEAFEAIERAETLLQEAETNATALLDKVHDLVICRFTQDAQMVPLRKVTHKIGSGATPRGGRAAYKSSGTTLVRSMNVYDRRFVSDGLAFITEEQSERLSAVALTSQDVLLNITGASVARCCTSAQVPLPARVNQHVLILRPALDRLLPEFLCSLLTSPRFKSQLLGIGEGAGSTRQAITKGQMEAFGVPVPSMGHQREACQQFSAVEASLQALTASRDQKRDLLEALREQILTHAFAGKLASARPREIVVSEAIA